MKYITNETIHKFKKILNRLHKKEEDALLNKKKKREEIKQKNRLEKTKMNNINNISPPSQYNIYPNMYMPPMQINNQNPAYFNEYQNFYYLNPAQSYQINPQMMQPFMPNSYLIAPKTLEESVNIIYNRGMVNNIIGASFIKECQDKQINKEKRKVPVAKVELDEKKENGNENNNNINNREEKEEKENIEEKKEEENKEEKNKDNNEQKNDNELKMPSMV